MTPISLHDLLDSGEFEDDGSVTISGFTSTDDAIDLRLRVRPDPEATCQTWSITCDGVRVFRIENGDAWPFGIYDEHPLLMPHQQIRSALYLSGPASNAGEVAADLWVAHRKATSDWHAPHRFLNSQCRLSDLLAAGYGMLAEGPRDIVAAYQGVLRRHGIGSTTIGDRDPVRWIDGRWVSESELLKVLVAGSSFVVAEAFAEPIRLE